MRGDRANRQIFFKTIDLASHGDKQRTKIKVESRLLIRAALVPIPFSPGRASSKFYEDDN